MGRTIAVCELEAMMKQDRSGSRARGATKQSTAYATHENTPDKNLRVNLDQSFKTGGIRPASQTYVPSPCFSETILAMTGSKPPQANSFP